MLYSRFVESFLSMQMMQAEELLNQAFAVSIPNMKITDQKKSINDLKRQKKIHLKMETKSFKDVVADIARKIQGG